MPELETVLCSSKRNRKQTTLTLDLNQMAMQHNTALTLTQMQYNAMECNEMKCSLNTNQNAMEWNTIECNGMQCNAMECSAIGFYFLEVKLTAFSLKPIITIITAWDWHHWQKMVFCALQTTWAVIIC